MDENHTVLWYDDHTILGMILRGMIFIAFLVWPVLWNAISTKISHMQYSFGWFGFPFGWFKFAFNQWFRFGFGLFKHRACAVPIWVSIPRPQP